MLKKNKPYKPSNQTLKLYKECVINILIDKYKFSEREAKHWYKEFGFDEILVACDYVGLNDDPEYVADYIYEYYLLNSEVMK